MGDGLEHNCFSPVTDEGLAALLGCKLRPHPDKVAEAAALASVASPNLKYSLCLPKEILLSEPLLLAYLAEMHVSIRFYPCCGISLKL